MQPLRRQGRRLRRRPTLASSPPAPLTMACADATFHKTANNGRLERMSSAVDMNMIPAHDERKIPCPRTVCGWIFISPGQRSRHFNRLSIARLKPSSIRSSHVQPAVGWERPCACVSLAWVGQPRERQHLSLRTGKAVTSIVSYAFGGKPEARDCTQFPASAYRGRRWLISSKECPARDHGVALLDPADGSGCVPLIQRSNLGICLARVLETKQQSGSSIAAQKCDENPTEAGWQTANVE
jgi:hypothetical protein